MFPHALQEPHPPIFLAGATERSIGVAGRMGFGLMLSSWTPFDTLARHIALYRRATEETPAELRKNAARGHVDVTRYVYVAETDAKARAESEAVILRHLKHFSSGHTSGLSRHRERGTDRLRGALARRHPARLARDRDRQRSRRCARSARTR